MLGYVEERTVVAGSFHLGRLPDVWVPGLVEVKVVGLEAESNHHPVCKTMSLKTSQHSLH